MIELLNFVYFVLFIIVLIAIAIFSFKLGKSEKFDKQDREMHNLKLLADGLMHAERSRTEEIEKSIGGITSVNISPLRYVQLIRAEEELNRIRNAK